MKTCLYCTTQVSSRSHICGSRECSNRRKREWNKKQQQPDPVTVGELIYREKERGLTDLQVIENYGNTNKVIKAIDFYKQTSESLEEYKTRVIA